MNQEPDEMEFKTPVAFFIFNRPNTTARVFSEIRRAKPAKLLVVADGPRPERADEADLCTAARRVVEQVDWPCEVLKNYAQENLGCRGRVSSGLAWVFSEVEEAIILEDDCLPEPGFFHFCEKLLEKYRHDEKVMMIGGTNYLLDRLRIPESYCFSRYFAIWGWATWRRAWNRYDITMRDWPRFRRERQLDCFYPQRFMRRRISGMFEDAYQGRIDTWDIQWFFSCLSNGGLSIVPRVNLVSNIGTTGTHSSEYSANVFFQTFSLDTDDLVHPRQVCQDLRYDNVFFSERLKTTPSVVAWAFAIFLKKRFRRLRRLVKTFNLGC
jgi:hypothetical protein